MLTFIICSLARLLKNYLTDLYETWKVDGAWKEEKSIQFSIQDPDY